MKVPARSQIQRSSVSAAILVLVGVLVAAAHGRAETNQTTFSPDTLTGRWRVRRQLQSRGLHPFATLAAEAWGNAAGGIKTGAWSNQLLDFGLELDTTELGWWQGGSIFVQAHWVERSGGRSRFEDYTGGFNPVSSVMAGEQLRIFNLYYQHAWKAETVLLKLGQIAVDDDFMGSHYSSLFLNSAFGAMPSQVGTPLAASCGNSPAFPIYSVAAPGVFLRINPLKSIYSQLGLYYGRPGLDTRSNYGFDWMNEAPAELGLFWENGFAYNLAQHPATVRLGLTYHTGELDDFRGAPVDDPPATHQAVPNYYVAHDFQLLADGEGKPKLGLFCRGGLSPDPDASMVSFYADAGLNWFAPTAGRPDDAAGIGVSYTRFGRAFREYSGPNGVASGETTLELTYKAQITAWMALQADVQFLFAPAANPETGRRQTATVAGLRATINF